ncbi:MAG: hypothetical protein QM677_06735 [Microbacterium sp.]
MAPTMTPTSGAQAQDLLSDCLREFGWIVEDDGSVETTTAQLDQYLADIETCDARIATREWTDTDYESSYEGLLASLACLQEEGYATPSDTPSLQVFIEQRSGTTTGSIWDPYSEIAPGELAAVLARCPQPDPIF